MTRIFAAIVVLVLSLMPLKAAEDFVILQSTTSTQNSGLLDAILPEFQRETGVEVRVVAVGTGQALRNAQNGDGDVVLVHARAAEEAFVAAGWGKARHDVMYNDFVIVGPPEDPAGIASATSAARALSRIADSRAIFLSRGDQSGTHVKELQLWDETGVDVANASGTWYRETGAGMGTTLNIAIEMNGYVLTDRSTWIAYGHKRGHDILFQGDPDLFNQYGVILVNPERYPSLNTKGAKAFQDWLLGPSGQRAIAAFRVNGTQLFFPNAGTD